MNVRVRKSQCTNADCSKYGIFHYADGKSQHLVNYNNSQFFTHELLTGLLKHLTSGKRKTFADYHEFVKVLYMTHRCKLTTKMFSRGRLIDIFCHWCQELVFKNVKMGCNLCDPDQTGDYGLLVADGTNFTARAQYGRDLFGPLDTKHCHNKVVNIKYSKSTRFIVIPKFRKLGERFICDLFGRRAVDKFSPLNVCTSF